jgi:hypothetical protein
VCLRRLLAWWQQLLALGLVQMLQQQRQVQGLAATAVVAPRVALGGPVLVLLLVLLVAPWPRQLQQQWQR